MKNLKTTLSGLLSLVFLGLWFYSIINTDTLLGAIVLVSSYGFISAADADKLKKTFGNNRSFMVALLILPLFLGSCNKPQWDIFFQQMDKEVPIQKVSYKIAKPEKDTVIVYYAPYKIFKNTAEFKADTIGHTEEFNWQGLGDLLWEKRQEYKERRKNKKANKQSKEIGYLLPREGLLPKKLCVDEAND
jgi:hypothetical protein